MGDLTYSLAVPDLREVFTGAKVLACGGGGESEWAEPILKALEREGLTVQVATADELGSDDWVCVPGGLGAGTTPEIRKRLETVPKIAPEDRLVPEMGVRALDAFEERLGRRFDKFMAVNPGPVLWGLPMYLAAVRNRPILDGDAAGRAIPQWTTTTLNVAGLPLAPAVFVSAYGDQVTFDRTYSNERLEEIGRPVAVASGGWGAFIACPVRGEQLRDAYVPGLFQKAKAIGAALQDARERGEDPIPPLIEAAEGTKIFEGSVSAYERKEERGFMFGEIEVKGRGADAGKRCRVYQKSEYSLAWVDDEVAATAPDSICIVDGQTGEGLTSFPDFSIGPFPAVREADFQLGREIVIFGRDAHPIWQTERGIEIFGPRSLGFDIDYMPVTERAGSV